MDGKVECSVQDPTASEGQSPMSQLLIQSSRLRGSQTLTPKSKNALPLPYTVWTSSALSLPWREPFSSNLDTSVSIWNLPKGYSIRNILKSNFYFLNILIFFFSKVSFLRTYLSFTLQKKLVSLNHPSTYYGALSQNEKKIYPGKL